MKHLPWKLLGAAVLLGVAFDILFFNINMLGINVFLMQLLFIGVTFGLTYIIYPLQLPLTKGEGRRIPKRAWIPAGFALAFAATFAIWTSSEGLTLSGLGIFISNFYFLLFALGHHGKFHHPFNAVQSAFSDVAGSVLNRISIVSHLKLPGKTDKSTEIVRGIFIAIPILIVFAVLFLSSDLVLQDQTENFFTNFNEWLQSGKIIGHTFTIVAISGLFLGFFGAAFWKRIEMPGLKTLVKKHHIESTIILGTSILLFLGFILFQSYYLFGGQLAWNSIEGITYSEYAVQGFNELATVAALVILLILTLRYFHTEFAGKWMKILETVLLGETLLIIISAWMRMSLYVEQYGYTTARLFGFWFFTVTAVLLALLAYNILREKRQYKFIQCALIFCGVAMLVFTASAPDALSVRLNMARATDNNLYDATPHLERVSAEAYLIGGKALQEPLKNVNDVPYSFEELCEFTYDQHAFRDTHGQDPYNYIINYFHTSDLRDNWESRWTNESLSIQYPEGRGGKGGGTYHYAFEWQSWNLSRSKLPQDETVTAYSNPEQISNRSKIAGQCREQGLFTDER